MALDNNTSIDDVRRLYDEAYHDFEMFEGELRSRCTLDKKIKECKPDAIYTNKVRIKEWASLEKKVLSTDRVISKENLFEEISDVLGMRIVVLHPTQVFVIDEVIRQNVDNGRWRFREKPKAYEGDQRYVDMFNSRGFDVKEKPSYYTSLHYLIEQSSDPRICAEIQVRTLFEEIWGQVEHFVRYKAADSANGEDFMDDEMRVLSYIINTGKAHLDLVFRRYQ